MGKDIKIYRSLKSNVLGGVFVLAIVFFGLTLPLIIEGAPIPEGKLYGLIGFWTLGIILAIVPFGGKLEVGENYIKTYFFGFTTTQKIASTDVKQIEYRNLLLGGLGFGKGIFFSANINGRNKYYSIAESVYGKTAVVDAKRALELKD